MNLIDFLDLNSWNQSLTSVMSYSWRWMSSDCADFRHSGFSESVLTLWVIISILRPHHVSLSLLSLWMGQQWGLSGQKAEVNRSEGRALSVFCHRSLSLSLCLWKERQNGTIGPRGEFDQRCAICMRANSQSLWCSTSVTFNCLSLSLSLSLSLCLPNFIDN